MKMRGKLWLLALAGMGAMILSGAGEKLVRAEDLSQPLQANGEIQSGEDKESKTDEILGGYTREMLGELQLEEIQKIADEMLEEESFSLTQALGKILKGEQPFTREAFLNIVYEAVFEEFQNQRDHLLEVILLILAAAIFSNFSRTFSSGQVGEICFYVVYMVLFALLVNSFGSLSLQLEEKIEYIVNFMKVVTPAYFLAAVAANGVSTATMFYQVVLMVVLVIQVVAVHVILPCVNLYVLLELVNHLSREDVLSKLAQLLKMLVEWALKTMLGVLVGLQVVQSLVAPVIDQLRRTTVGRTAGAIPGVGNAINSVTEIILTSAVLIRNSLGLVVLAILVLWGLSPLVKYAVTGFLYKLLAALAQPVSDKRMVGCINTVGDGCILLMKVFFTVEMLCLITFLVIMGTAG